MQRQVSFIAKTDFALHVTVTDNGTVNDNVIGGWTDGDGAVSRNMVEISGTAGTVFSGSSDGDGDVTFNSVSISGTANAVVGGGSNGQGNVANNDVLISGTAQSVTGGITLGTGHVTQNKATINNGPIDYVYGGLNLSGNDGEVSDNVVTVGDNGEVITNVAGGWTNGDGDVSGNRVEINGTASGYVIGGHTDGDGDVTLNSVNISGTVSDIVLGGASQGGGNVSDNAVNIKSTAKLAGASLYGSNTSGVAGTGNTLNVNGFRGNIQTMGNFEHYNFMLGQLTPDLEFIIIDGTDVNLDDAKIYIGFTPEFVNNDIKVGDEIKVITAITSDEPDSVTVAAMPSSFIAYDFIETHDTGALKLIITGLAPQPQTKALGEAFAAGLAFLGQAADVRSSIYFVPQGPRFIPFAKMVYGKQYISTGSSVNVKGFSAIAGLALNTNFDNGSQLVVGAFVEGGWGDYDSRNSFNNFSAVKGKGDTEYYGGGVLARYALKSGLYGEGTFAAGKTETDFRSWDFAPGTRSKYDYSVPYYSAHVAVGQVLNLTEMLNLDVYGKYLWTRQEGENVTINGYRFKFKAADSHRVRVGGKLQADVSPQLQPYAGVAYEYEFSGKIKGSLYGMHMDKPSLRGGTGIGELGLVWTPNDAQNLRVDLGMQGYIGKREGVSGGLTVTMSF